jgi:hypothetical protein
MGSYPQLGDVARALGVPDAGEPIVTFDDGGSRVDVELAFDSGMVTGCIVRAHARPFPEVTLRRRTEIDEKGTREGINVEVQTGVPDFDARVYLETDAYGDAVRELLARPATRAAVCSLLFEHGAEEVSFHGEGVSAYLPGTDMRPDRVLSVLPALRELRVAPAVPLAEKPRPSTVMPGCVLGASVPSGVIALGAAVVTGDPDGFSLPLLSAAAALVIAAVLRFVLRRRIRGHTRAYADYRTALAWGVVACLLWVPGLAIFCNGVLDPGTPVRRPGKVVEVTREGEHAWQAVDEGRYGRISTRWTGDEVCAGDEVVRTTRPGLLGFAHHASATLTRTAPRPCAAGTRAR